MTSTSVTTLGGVVVVTQVIPKEESGIQLQAANQAPPPPTKATPPATQTLPSSKMDDMTAAFLKGEPLSLGVVQIFIGLLCIIFSVTAAFSQTLIVHAPFCIGAIFLVSGYLAVVAARRTSVGLVCACLVWNLFSILLGLGGVAYSCWLLADHAPSRRLCDTGSSDGFVPTEEDRRKCSEMLHLVDVCVYGLLGLLLVLLVLQVCVTITICVFSGKALRRRERYVPIKLEVDDVSALFPDPASRLDSDVSLLDSEGVETSTSPPNSP